MIIRCIKAILALTREQVRALYSIAMLFGIVALSVESWVLLGIAYNAAQEGEASAFFGLLVTRLRYVSVLTGMFALIVALVVFGADYFRAKWGDNELSAGKGEGKGEGNVK